MELLKQAADRFRQINQNGILLLVSQNESRLNFVCAVTDDVIRKGIKAGELVKVLAQVTEGGGGGDRIWRLPEGKIRRNWRKLYKP